MRSSGAEHSGQSLYEVKGYGGYGRIIPSILEGKNHADSDYR